MQVRVLLLSIFVLTGAASAQSFAPELQAIIDRVAEGAIPLSHAGDPATDIWLGNSTVLLSVRNVTQARLTPVLPDPGTTTGAAVIIVPVGGNFLVAQGNEGVPVAERLAKHGIAAFLLTYRTVPTPVNGIGFAGKVAGYSVGVTLNGYDKPIPGEAEAREDMQAAIRLVRARARVWGLNAGRIGALGFSAGAIATLNTVLDNRADARLAFAGLMYGRMVSVKPPLGAPPIFVAVASNDLGFGRQGFGLVEAWMAAGRSVEFHYHAKGGHGFGMKQQGTTSDQWLVQFRDRLQASGFLGG